MTDIESGNSASFRGDGAPSDVKNPIATDARQSDAASVPVAEAQAEVDAAFEEWVASSRLAPIRGQLITLGVADKADLADLDTADLRDLRSGLTKVGQKKFDRDLESVGISLGPVTAVAAEPKSTEHGSEHAEI